MNPLTLVPPPPRADGLSDDYRLRTIAQKLIWRGFTAGVNPKNAREQLDTRATRAWVILQGRGYTITPVEDSHFSVFLGASWELTAPEMAVLEYFEKIRR